MNAYILGLDLSAMGFVLLFFSLAIQLSILFRLAWQAASVNGDFANFPLIANNRVFNLELVNTYNDRAATNIMYSNSLVDAMANGLTIVIAMMTILGRVGPL